MSDNRALPPVSGKAATDEVTYSGDADAHVQLFRPVHVTGSEGSRVVADIIGTSTPGGSAPGIVVRDAGQVTTIGALTETAPATDTASSGLNGRLQRIAQRLSSLIALLPTALGANGGLKVEGVSSGTVIPVSLSASSIAAATPFLANALSNTAVTVVASAKTLDSYYLHNPNTAKAYVQLFDAASVTVGTTVPKWSICVPPESAANLANVNLGFSNSIKVAATTTPTGSTAPSTALDCNFGYIS